MQLVGTALKYVAFIKNKTFLFRAYKGLTRTQYDIYPLIKPVFIFWLWGRSGDYYKLLPDIFITSDWEVQCYLGHS